MPGKSLMVIEGGKPDVDLDQEIQLMADTVKKIYLHMQKRKAKYSEQQLQAASRLAFRVDVLAQELGMI